MKINNPPGWATEHVLGNPVLTKVIPDDSKIYLGFDFKTREVGFADKKVVWARIDAMPWWILTGLDTLQAGLDLFDNCQDETHFYNLVDVAGGVLSDV